MSPPRFDPEAVERQPAKVAGYEARHLARRPSSAVGKTRRRYSPPGRRHDPLREPGS